MNLPMHQLGKNKGFSIVELMVALVIGLMVVLVATGSASFLEANRRNTISGDGAQENALAVAYILQNGARSAGYGQGITGCNITDPLTLNGSAITFKSFPKAPTCTNADLLTQTYSLSNENFTDGTDALAEGIVGIHYKCGLSSSDTTTAISSWADCATTTDTKLRALRLIVFARASAKDKLSDGTACDATVAADNAKQGLLPTKDQPSYTFSDSAIAVTASLSSSDWKCYRYRAVGLTIPLKNILIQTVNTANPVTN